jgi:mono/diheme cytochrome c family protein
MSTVLVIFSASIAVLAAADADDRQAVERGRVALTTTAFNVAIWPRSTYEQVWRQWGLTEKPADYAEAVARRYGLHPSPYDNDGLPMGLRPARTVLGGRGITTDCMICHGSSLLGQSYIGLGNSSLDLEALFEEMSGLGERQRKVLFPFTNVRGTSEAAAMAVFLFSIRNEDLTLRAQPLDLGLRADLCEDPPAWWLLKKKKTMYHDGSTSSRSVRSLMQFTLSPVATLEQMKNMEATFKDVQAYLLSLKPPKYPLPTDPSLVEQGRVLFEQRCASCHGTYGANGSYPNKIISLDEIGTDPTRALAITERAKHHYESTWFGQEVDDQGRKLQYRLSRGYQAPPLDGVWATAPYFHNGSVPTLYHVLHSESRPKFFTRSYGTSQNDYDFQRVGWRVNVLSGPADPTVPAIERRRVYDTTLPGRGNGGHTFGDSLTEAERWAVIEYLKTL